MQQNPSLENWMYMVQNNFYVKPLLSLALDIKMKINTYKHLVGKTIYRFSNENHLIHVLVLIPVFKFLRVLHIHCIVWHVYRRL